MKGKCQSNTEKATDSTGVDIKSRQKCMIIKVRRANARALEEKQLVERKQDESLVLGFYCKLFLVFPVGEHIDSVHCSGGTINFTCYMLVKCHANCIHHLCVISKIGKYILD